MEVYAMGLGESIKAVECHTAPNPEYSLWMQGWQQPLIIAQPPTYWSAFVPAAANKL